MPEQKQLTDNVINHLLKSALVTSADLPKLKNSIHSLLGIVISVSELKQMNDYQQLFDKIKAEQTKSNSR